MKLSTEDRIEINDLYSRYVYAFDQYDGEAWAALFTADGVFVREGEDDLVGAKELSAFVSFQQEHNPGVKHFVSNILVEPSDQGAHGRAYVFAARLYPPDVVLGVRSVGSYEDELVRTADGWRFARRSFERWLPLEVSGSSFVLSPPTR